MTKTSPEKPLIKRLFENKDVKEPPKANDIEQVVLQQHKSARQIKKKLVDDTRHNQHKAVVGTADLVSQLKHLKHIEKKRQKLANQYIMQQRDDPSLSPLKIVQTIIPDQDTLPPLHRNKYHTYCPPLSRVTSNSTHHVTSRKPF